MLRRLTIRCQWPLKYFLLLMAVLVLAMGWWTRSAALQRNAVRALESQGFTVTYRWLPIRWDSSGETQQSDGLLTLEQYDRLPKLVKRFLDKHYFVSVGSVITDGRSLGSIDISPIRHLKGPQLIALESVKVTDDSLAVLRFCDHLEMLSLRDLDISDEALVHVGQLTSLRYLDLTEVRISDSGLQHLRPLKQLVTLAYRTRWPDVSQAAG